MTKAQIQQWIAEGYHVLQDGQPKKIEGDLWEFLDTLDEEDTDVIALVELATWDEGKLANLHSDDEHANPRRS